jgi:glycosyltransferase involved in cell wall biosynthesis
VATVHDVFGLSTRPWAEETFRVRERKRYADVAERAARVIFPSQATRDAYLAVYPGVRGRDVVVPHGVAPWFRPQDERRIAAALRQHRLPPRYLLYVGRVEARKNLDGMARAVAIAGLDLPWVWIGPDGFGAAEAAAAAEREGIAVVRRRSLASEALPAVFAGAVLLTFVTHEEGFGLPALEAMACGTPVVASDRGAGAEVVGSAGRCVSPEEPEAMAAALREVAREGPQARDLAARGRLRAAGYAWAATARATWAVYADAAACRG